MIGHLLGAAGGVEAIVCIKSMQDQFIHTNAGFEETDPECDLDCIRGEGQSTKVNISMSNSLGFGGHNASIIFKNGESVC